MNWDIFNFAVGLYLLIGALLTTTNNVISAIWFRVIPGVFGVFLIVRYLSLIGALSL